MFQNRITDLETGLHYEELAEPLYNIGIELEVFLVFLGRTL